MCNVQCAWTSAWIPDIEAAKKSYGGGGGKKTTSSLLEIVNLDN